MRLGELAGKEIININDGARLGVIGETDLSIDDDTGRIISIMLPRRGNLLGLFAEKQELIIPWESIRKIGFEVIIVELDQAIPRYGKYLV